MTVSTDFASYLPLSVTKDDKTGLRILDRDFKIIVDDEMITIPKGFDTDYSSYPFFSRVIVRFDRVDVAGVVHDYLYRVQRMSRREADRVWRKVAMHGDKSANIFQGWSSWLGLRIGGWLAWNSRKKDLNNN